MTRPLSRRAFLRQSIAAGSAAFASCTAPPDEPLDLLLRGGTVVDGSGAPGHVADVGIRGDRVAAVGALPGARARRELDARGLTVAPGFVDVHAHSDLRRQPRAQSKLFQGVTLDVTGPDGSSAFPARLPGSTGPVTSPDHCSSCTAWAAGHGPIAIDVGSYVGHGTVRELVLGPSGRAPQPGELRTMQDLLAQAFEQGALGLSSGLEYFPGNMATTDELVELCKVAARYDRPYVTHVRNEDDRLLEAIDEAIEIARRSGAPLLISHLKVGGKPNWHKIDALLQRIDRARAEGLELRCDCYPYEAWSTGLAANFPGWAKEGGRFVARLRDPAERARMRAETEQAVAANGGWGVLMLGGGLGAADRDLRGRRLDEAASARGVEPFELACDLLTRGAVSILGFGIREADMDRILAQPWCLVASDGGAVAPSGRGGHPRSFGTFPRVLRRLVREQRRLSLEEAVRRMTSLPAETLRLRDRGLVAPGKVANVVLFDAARFTDRATYLEPQRCAEGVVHLVVNGALAVDGELQTEAMAGRVVRG